MDSSYESDVEATFLICSDNSMDASCESGVDEKIVSPDFIEVSVSAESARESGYFREIEEDGANKLPETDDEGTDEVDWHVKGKFNCFNVEASIDISTDDAEKDKVINEDLVTPGQK